MEATTDESRAIRGGGTVVGRNDRLSRDQKRKAKLKKRAERSKKHESLAYHGNKYKTPEFVSIVHRTEVGIYESYVMSGRTLTDDDVESSLERLIGLIPQGTRSLTSETDDLAVEEVSEDLTIWNIRRNWEILEERDALPGHDDLVGVLRTLLHSLEIWRSKEMHARGYLHFLEGFMKETGVRVERVTPEQLSRRGIEVQSVKGLGHDEFEDEE